MKSLKTFETFENSKEIDKLIADLSEYVYDIDMKWYADNICTVIFYSENVGNNKLYYMKEATYDSKNISGEFLKHKGEKYLEILNFNRNTYRTNMKQLEELLDMLKKGSSFYVDRNMKNKLNK